MNSWIYGIEVGTVMIVNEVMTLRVEDDMAEMTSLQKL